MRYYRLIAVALVSVLTVPALGQEPRADRPTIGLRTILLAAEAGLRGIAVGANATIVLDRDEVIRAADRVGLFLVGIDGS